MNFEVINSKKREMGMTNAQLAEKTGVTLSTLDKITSGANQNPKLSTLQAIARVLGCTLDDFDDVNTLEQVISPAPYRLPRNMTDSTATLRQSSRRSLIWSLRGSIHSVVRRLSKSAAIYPKRHAIIRVLKQPDDICIRRG